MSTHVRVSEILAQFKDFSSIDPRVLNTKANIGTEVHRNIHLYTTGITPIYDSWPNFCYKTNEIKSWEDRGEGYFRSYMKWHEKERPEYMMMEQRFYDDNLMITGQIDALRHTYDETISGEQCDGYPILIDFKCSYQSDPEIWGMQAHYYKHLLEHNGIRVADTFLWMRLKKDGKMPEILEITYEDNIMQRCIDEAILFWERKSDAKEKE